MHYKLMMLTLYICITGNLKLKIFEGNIIVINFWKEADFLQLNLKTILHFKKFTEMTIKSFVIGFFTNQALLLFIIFSIFVQTQIESILNYYLHQYVESNIVILYALSHACPGNFYFVENA